MLMLRGKEPEDLSRVLNCIVVYTVYESMIFSGFELA